MAFILLIIRIINKINVNMNFSGQADRARIQALEEYDGQAYKFHKELLSAFLYLFTEERIDVFAMAV